MIAGPLETVWEQVPPNLHIAFAYIHRKSWEGLPEGGFEIKGSALWGMVQIYETEPTPPQEFETHRHHVDVHYMVSGEETIYWIPGDHLEPHGTYDEARDVWIATLAAGPEQVTPLRLRAGDVAVFFPSDGHWPRRANTTPTPVKKILLKVPVGS